MAVLSLKIINKDETTIAVKSNEEEVCLVYGGEYKEGDKILVECEKDNAYLMLQLDDAIGECLVYLKNRMTCFEVPWGEKKICYSPKSFSGSKHLLLARFATKEEVMQYRNLALNKYDQHGDHNCFPHAYANVETRGESVFAAKNAINGNHENHSHGEWPYESWGINRNPDATITISFGRSVVVDKMLMYMRADFPHDSWWTEATLTFSDGSELVWKLEKSDMANVVTFDKKTIEWVEVSKLIKADDPSPFPALSQLEIYGVEA